MSTDQLVDDLSATVLELRGSLTELLAAVGADSQRPQELSRSLGLDKNLARKISRIILSPDPGDVVAHLPGAAGFNLVLSAAERSGARLESLRRARDAVRSMEGVVERHVGDRPTLEMVIDGLPGRSKDRLLQSRKLSFRGDSGIWGVQAKVRVNTAILVPSPTDPGMIDHAAMGVWIGFRRLRSDAPWALFRRRKSGQVGPSPVSPVDPAESPDGPMLLRDFCSATLPPIHRVTDPNGDQVHELGPSPVGNTGSFDCFSAWFNPGIGARYAADDNSTGEFGSVVSAPAETLVFDLIVHRDLRFALNTSVRIFGTASSYKDLTIRDQLPLVVEPTSLGAFPAVVDTPLVPRYAEAVEYVMQRCGWDRRDFTGLRFVVEYPPYPSTMVVSFPLDKRPPT